MLFLLVKCRGWNRDLCHLQINGSSFWTVANAFNFVFPGWRIGRTTCLCIQPFSFFSKARGLLVAYFFPVTVSLHCFLFLRLVLLHFPLARCVPPLLVPLPFLSTFRLTLHCFASFLSSDVCDYLSFFLGSY